MMYNDCRDCQGTGIGQHGDPDTSKCTTCLGRGYIADDPFYDDYPDDNVEEMIAEAEKENEK